MQVEGVAVPPVYEMACEMADAVNGLRTILASVWSSAEIPVKRARFAQYAAQVARSKQSGAV
jgi:hypothetical protein